LNVYYIPALPKLTADKVEAVYLKVLETVKSGVSIPVSMKLSPFFSSPGNLIKKLDDAGADAVVLFNRFYQPDIDPNELEVTPTLTLSTPWESRLPLRWIAIMYGQLNASMSASTGIYSGTDVAKMVLAGADAVQACSALLRHGVGHTEKMLKELELYMQSKEYESIEQMKGVMSQRKCAEPAAFERANYMKALTAYGPTSTFE
jgi:dihydroorotate dehydrogenase (fumarate)